MKIKGTKLPWVVVSKRSNPDPFYNSTSWKRIRQSFKLGTTKLPDGREVPNHLCVECYKEGKLNAMYVVDHIIRIKDGGSRTDLNNLQGLCEHHHAIKSAEEGKIRK
jgi:5-methylcytosine-specific restriction protein A